LVIYLQLQMAVSTCRKFFPCSRPPGSWRRSNAPEAASLSGECVPGRRLGSGTGSSLSVYRLGRDDRVGGELGQLPGELIEDLQQPAKPLRPVSAGTSPLKGWWRRSRSCLVITTLA